MTAKAFVQSVEKYYGAYPNAFMRNAVARYMTRFNEAEIGAIQEQVFLAFSSQYGKTPDVAAIEAIRKSTIDDIRKRSGALWQDERGLFMGDMLLGHYDGGQFIPDLTAVQGSPLLLEYVEEFRGESPTPEKYMDFLKREGAIEAPTECAMIEDRREGDDDGRDD